MFPLLTNTTQEVSEMPMALPDNGYRPVIKPVLANKSPSSLAERCETIAKTCEKNAEALERKMESAEDRKTLLNLPRTWYSPMHDGQVAITVKVGTVPILFA